MKRILILDLDNSYNYSIKSNFLKNDDLFSLPLRIRVFLNNIIQYINNDLEWIIKENIKLRNIDDLIITRLMTIERIVNFFKENKIADIVKGSNLERIEKKYYFFLNKDKQLINVINDYCLDDFNLYKSNIENIITNRKLSKNQLINSFFAYKMKRTFNFSVPGAGKTSTILSTYLTLKLIDKVVKKLVVVGPKSSFKSWVDEYFNCIGVMPNFATSDDIRDKNKEWREIFIKRIFLEKEIILINYESLNKYKVYLKEMINEDVFLVFDEAHKIKRKNGIWGEASIYISENAEYKVILTGTPLPNGFQDLFNSMNILFGKNYKNYFGWSYDFLHNQTKEFTDEFRKKISPFYVRTTKKELGVPDPEPNTVIEYELSHQEIDLYNKVFSIYKNSPFVLVIRLLQVLSSPKQLNSNIDKDYYFNDIEDEINNENKFKKTFSKPIYDAEIFSLSNELVVSTKIKLLINLCKQILSNNKKVLIWSNFIQPMQDIKEMLLKIGIKSEIINGNTLLDDREKIIDEFNKTNNLNVLITNPQTLSESVSLHHNCHDAIYLDFSYNLTHMIQSRDRIHRFGLGKNTKTKYYYFVAKNVKNSIEKIIYKSLSNKEEIMNSVINSNKISVEENTSDDNFIEEIFNLLTKRE